jgi:hypothetical protein
MDHETLLQNFRNIIREKALNYDHLQERAKDIREQIETCTPDKTGYHKACLSMVEKHQTQVYTQFQAFRTSYIMICQHLDQNGYELSMEDQLQMQF